MRVDCILCSPALNGGQWSLVQAGVQAAKKHWFAACWYALAGGLHPRLSGRPTVALFWPAASPIMGCCQDRKRADLKAIGVPGADVSCPCPGRARRNCAGRGRPWFVEAGSPWDHAVEPLGFHTGPTETVSAVIRTPQTRPAACCIAKHSPQAA